MENKHIYIYNIVALCLLSLSILSFSILSSSKVLAEDNTAVSTATVTVSESCVMDATVDTPHTANLVNGTYSGTNYPTGIGQTTLKVFCNDNNGFAIYAIGYTNDEYGNNKLHWSGATSTSDTTNDINTGIYSSGATTSSWSMKLAAISGTYAATIDDGVSANNNSTDNFTNWHIVPTEYKRVAYRTSGTDTNANNNGTGSSITTTYDAYVSATQPAGTYTGQVKYTLVHPNKSDNSNRPVYPISASVAPDNAIIFAPNTSDTEGDMSTLPYTQDSSAATLRTASPRAGAISATANSTAELIAPNFKREGYGFAGWSTAYDASTATNPIIYGPNETISTNPNADRGLDVSGGAVLYPVWIAKEANVTMQTFNSTNYSAYTSAPNGTVIALEDERDHDVYAVAKLADGKWWMIENLRLDDSATLTTTNTHNPLHDTNNIVTLKTDYTNNTVATHLAASNNTWCASYNAACYDQTMLNTNNTRLSDSSLSPSYNDNNATSKWYGYGNYYNWYSATAGNGTYSFNTNNNSVTGDLCPAGWHLPKGGNIYNTVKSEFWALSLALIGAEPANISNASTSIYPYYTGTPEGSNASNAFRAYPNNFVYSGRWGGAQAYYRSTQGYYWSSSAYGSGNAFDLYFYSSVVHPGTYRSLQHNGNSVRCVKSLPTIDDVESLQDFNSFNSQEMTSVLNSMTTGQAYHIPDNRDNESYTIAKLADGNVWMLDNMKLDLSNSSVKAKLNSSTTNAPDNALALLANNVTDGTINSYTTPQIVTAYKNTTNGTPYGNGSGKAGIYYNYCAASAGTICDDSSTSDATNDICPAGWRLPTGGTNSEFHELCLAYDSNCSSGSSSLAASNTASVQYNLSQANAGWARNSNLYMENYGVLLWSSTYSTNGSNGPIMYDMYLTSTGANSVESFVIRDYGISMRCIVNK